jgi:hypothetical protein
MQLVVICSHDTKCLGGAAMKLNWVFWDSSTVCRMKLNYCPSNWSLSVSQISLEVMMPRAISWIEEALNSSMQLDTVNMSSQVRPIACRLFRIPVQNNTLSSASWCCFQQLRRSNLSSPNSCFPPTDSALQIRTEFHLAKSSTCRRKGSSKQANPPTFSGSHFTTYQSCHQVLQPAHLQHEGFTRICPVRWVFPRPHLHHQLHPKTKPSS